MPYLSWTIAFIAFSRARLVVLWKATACKQHDTATERAWLADLPRNLRDAAAQPRH